MCAHPHEHLPLPQHPPNTHTTTNQPTHTHTHITAVSHRGQKLDQSYAYQQFSANVEEEESWIGEKLHLLSGGDYGDTMAAVQVPVMRTVA